MTRKNCCYFYPNPNILPVHQRNPYISNLIEGLQKDFEVVNINEHSKFGVLDLIKYAKKIQFVFFNFIENLPDKRYGIIQSLFLIFFILSAGLFRIKIVWVMHNKLSHNKKRFILKKIVFKLLTRRSDLIFTHAKEGIQFGKKITKTVEKRMLFVQHPVGDEFLEMNPQIKKEIDILIWGTMNEYKGITEFLNTLKEYNRLNSYSIMIAGYFTSNEYYNIVNAFKSDKIDVVNDYVSDVQLNELFYKSKIILFPYNPDSILSSGALMSSLKAPAFLVGPHTASFADMSDEKVIFSFKNHEHLIHLLDELLANNLSFDENIEIRKRFIKENTWTRITTLVNKEISGRLL